MTRRSRRLSREQKKAQTRQRLLRAAEEVFAERGFFAASVEEVAERAGFSMGAVYSNFESKGDLYAKAVERAFQQTGDWMIGVAKAAPKGQELRAMACRPRAEPRPRKKLVPSARTYVRN